MKDVPGICHPNRSDQAITGIGLCMEPRMPLPWEWNRSRCDGVPGKKNIEAANANGCVNLISGVKAVKPLTLCSNIQTALQP